MVSNSAQLKAHVAVKFALGGFKSGARAGGDSLLPAALHRGGNA
jgi:hypothetical protein